MRSGTSGISAEKNAPRELRGAGGQCAQHQRFAPQARDLPMGRVLVPRHRSIKKSFLSFFWIVLCHISILISLLVQWLTESRFGKVKFGIPIEKRSLMSAGIGCTMMMIFYCSFRNKIYSSSAPSQDPPFSLYM